MNRLKGNVNPEEQGLATERPTRYKTDRNVHQLHCSECGDLFWVDEQTLQKATSTLEGDPSEIAFYCEDCEEEYQEEGRAH